MKYLFAVCLLCGLLGLGALPAELEILHKDLGIQAAQFKDSPEHLALRSRDPRSYNVGDTHTFWRWNLSVMPPLWIQTPATCRAVGEHSYIFVADSEWNVHMTQANVDSVLVRLEDRTVNDPTQGAIEMDIGLFGPIPDELDNDPKLIVFYSALGSFQGTSFDGYFSPYNQVTEAQAQQMNPPGHSNECEMIYMTCYPLSPVAPIRLSVLAHELQHLIHWGQDANEETWLNEGCAELAMVAYGIPDPITGFPSSPDNSLTAWNQTTADYVKVMLFFTYLQEHYDATGLISDLVADPLNGIASLTQLAQTQYPETGFEGIFRNWNIANIVDAPTPGDGLYNYAQLDLPLFSRFNLNANPYPSNLTIQPFSADYLVYTFGDPIPMVALTSSDIYLTAAYLDQMGNCTQVVSSGLDSMFALEPGDPAPYQAVYILSNPGPNQIIYHIVEQVANDDASVPGAVTALTGNSPNPFSASTRITYTLKEALPLRLEIFNAKGQKVRTLLDASGNAGSHSVLWDGRDEAGKPVAAGVYLARLSAGTQHGTRKMLLLNGGN